MTNEPTVYSAEQGVLVGTGENYANDLLRNYSGLTHSPRAYEHPLRTSELLRDFVGFEIDPFLLEVAKFHDVADQARDAQLGKNARQLLYQYAKSLSDEKRDYFDSVLSNMQDVEQTAERCRENVGEKGSRLRAVISERNNRNQVIEPSLWLEDSEITSPQEMLDLINRVNLEAVLIKAAELLDNLKHPAPTDIAIFQDMHEADSFYVPLLEILGYDGFAMALRDQAFRIKLEKSGNGAYIHEAERMLSRIGAQEEVATFISKIFGGVGNDFFMDAIVSNISGQHSIRIGELVHAVPGDSETREEKVLRGVWRVKTVGSLAMKLFRKGKGYTPYDLIGISVIPEDVKGVAQYLGMFVSSMFETEGVELVTTNSKEAPIYISGGEDFNSSIVRELKVPTSVQVVPNLKNDYQVAKVTFRAPDEFGLTYYPCELQVLTEADRVAYRIGSGAHFAYKSRGKKNTIFTRETLEEIKRRRSDLGKVQVNPSSSNSANQFRNLYKNSKPRD